MDVNKYNRIHYWLKVNYGIANKCELCGCTGENKRYEWSLLKGCTYEKNRSNFWMLCKSCHVKYDFTEGGRKRLKEANLGRILSVETKKKMSEKAKRRNSFNVDNLNPQKAINENTILEINTLYTSSLSVKDICSKLNVSKPTVYKYLKNKPNRR